MAKPLKNHTASAPNDSGNNQFLHHNNQIIANIHVDDLNYVEKDLEFNDKASLILLLYGDKPLKAKFGLQILLIAYRSQRSHTTFLQEWVQSQNSAEWRLVLIEALWTIKAKHVLQKLGLDLDDLHIRFLEHAAVNVNIHPILKALYCVVCEQLSPHEARELIDFVAAKHGGKVDVNFTDEKYLEVFLLLWLSELVIEAGEWIVGQRKRNVFCNVDVILEFLKLEKPSLADELRRIVIRFNFTSNNVTSIEKAKNVFHDDGKTENDKLTKNDPKRKNSSNNNLQSESEDKYCVRRGTCGYVLVINQIEFYRDTVNTAKLPKKKLDKRHGSDKDGIALKKTFQSLGYQIIKKKNLTDCEILEEVDAVVSLSGKKDSLIVCILSHGSDGLIYGSNSLPVKIKEIQDRIVSKQLLNKPKILILQSCQGEETQIAEPIVNNLIDSRKLALDGPFHGSIPMRSDFCVAKSTISGFSSIRHIENGSWFIQNLCDVINEHGNRKHFLDIMTIVKRRVTELRGDNRECMVPICEDTFTKYFYFPQNATT